MANVVSRNVETGAINQTSEHVKDVEIYVETDDGGEHTVMFGLDEERYATQSPSRTPLFLADHQTDYTAFTADAASACSDAFDTAVQDLEQTIATMQDDNRALFDYSLDTHPYVLHVATYAPRTQTTNDSVPRPSYPQGYVIRSEEEVTLGTEFTVHSEDGVAYTVLFSDGRLVDAASTAASPTEATIEGLFNAIRAVQVEHINRGYDIDIGMNIELYHADH